MDDDNETTGLILGLRPANERRRYKVTLVSHWLSVNLRVPTGPYFREKSLFSIVALPALEKSLLLNIFDRSPGKVLIFNRCDKT